MGFMNYLCDQYPDVRSSGTFLWCVTHSCTLTVVNKHNTAQFTRLNGLHNATHKDRLFNLFHSPEQVLFPGQTHMVPTYELSVETEIHCS